MFRLCLIPVVFVFAGAITPASAAQVSPASPTPFSGVRSTPMLSADLAGQGDIGLVKRSSGQPNATGPSLSTGLSTALSVGGTDAASLSAPSTEPGGRINLNNRNPVVQRGAPTVQAAIGAAVSVGGTAIAGAQDTTGGEGGVGR